MCLLQVCVMSYHLRTQCSNNVIFLKRFLTSVTVTGFSLCQSYTVFMTQQLSDYSKNNDVDYDDGTGIVLQ